MAVNLGFAAGPAMGGLIIMGIGYKGLFSVDGASCIISILIFALLVKERKKKKTQLDIIEDTKPKSVFQDKPFWIFLFISFTTAMVFFQLFTTLPLYHHEQFAMTEFQTGLLHVLQRFDDFLSGNADCYLLRTQKGRQSKNHYVWRFVYGHKLLFTTY